MTDETSIDQASPQSMTDRIASKFGFPGAEAQHEEPATAEAQAEGEATGSDLADIEWEGFKFSAPPKVKEALMRNDDYTRKTQELADSRKSLDHSLQLAAQGNQERDFQGTIAAESQELAVIDAYLQQAAKLDWSQMTTDQMLRHKVEVDQIKERRDGLKSVINERRSAFQTEVKTKFDELRKNAWDSAVKKIGGNSEEAHKAVVAYGLSKGLTQSQMDNVLMHPASAEILWEASQFNKIKSDTSQAAARATKPTPVLRPGTAGERMPAKTAAQLNFSKAMKAAGNDSGAKARVIEQRLSGVFSK